jgi:hypothetical protein
LSMALISFRGGKGGERNVVTDRYMGRSGYRPLPNAPSADIKRQRGGPIIRSSKRTFPLWMTKMER